MCHRVACPNDGKSTWWGCGHHIESALAGVPVEERCTCEHERIPYLPVMMRVKRKNTHVSVGSCDDADLGLSVLSDGDAEYTVMVTSKRPADCSVRLELALPPSLALADPLPNGLEIGKTEKGDLSMEILPPATGVDIPLRPAAYDAAAPAADALEILGLNGGTLRRQWVCDGKDAGPMQDVHAKLTAKVSQQQSGFGLGGGIEPTHVVAALLFAWVLFRILSGSGSSSSGAKVKSS